MEEANAFDLAEGSAAAAAAAVFLAAPFVEERELRQLDVPDENLVELRGDIDSKELKSWLVQEPRHTELASYLEGLSEW